MWILTNNKPNSRKGRVQLIDARDLYGKMKRSLGNKRNELLDEHIAQIVSLYGDETENSRSKWAANTDLGYVKVPIQRPRRARIEGGPDALTRLKAHSDWQDLSVRKGTDDRDHIRDAVEQAVSTLAADGLSLAEAKEKLERADSWSSLLKKPQDAVLDALLVDDPEAGPLRDGKGNPVPDPDLRGYETVPLDRDIDQHLAAEVHPHAPDAWAEPDKAKVGYEIPFTEIFYVYEPPPPLEDIDAELRKVEQEILDLLAKVTK